MSMAVALAAVLLTAGPDKPGQLLLEHFFRLKQGAVEFQNIQPLADWEHKGPAEWTEADTKRWSPVPGPVWPAPRPVRQDCGWWLSSLSLSEGQHVVYDDYRSPEDFRVLSRAFDTVGALVTNEQNLTRYIEPRVRGTIEVFGPEYAYTRPLTEWLRQTGRPIFPVSMQTHATDGPDGCVWRTGALLQPTLASWRNVSFASPRTVRWTQRKIRGWQRSLEHVGARWDKRFVQTWNKEVYQHMGTVRVHDGRVWLGDYSRWAVEAYRSWCRRRFKTIEALNAFLHGEDQYTDWQGLRAPGFDQRLAKPRQFYLWMRCREWVFAHVGARMPVELGSLVVHNEGFDQTTFVPEGLWAGKNPYLWAQATDAYMCCARFVGMPRIYAVMAFADGFTRRDPAKSLRARFGLKYFLDWDPHYHDRHLVALLSLVTRLRGTHQLDWGAACTTPSLSFSNIRSDPAVVTTIDWWHAFGERQRALLSTLRTTPRRIAVFAPRLNGYYEPYNHTSKHVGRGGHDNRFWNWQRALRLMFERQRPVHLLVSEQVDAGWLDDYKVLYCLYGPRQTRRTLEAIETFHRKGGYVYGAFDALTWDLSGPCPATFEAIFHARPVQRLPGPPPFAPDPTMARRKVKKTYEYRIVADHPALPPKGTVLVARHGLMVVKPVGSDCRVYATHAGQPVIVGTRRSLFVGADVGRDLAYTTPGADPQATDKLLLGFADYAGIDRPATVLRNGKMPDRVLVGVLAGQGVRVVGVVDMAREPVPCTLRLRPWSRDEAVYDLRTGQRLPVTADGSIRLAMDRSGLRLLLVATPDRARPILDTQTQVNARPPLLPVALSRHFFIHYEAKDRLGIFRGPAFYDRRLKLQPGALIVLPDDPSGTDRTLADTVVALVRDAPAGEPWNTSSRIRNAILYRKLPEKDARRTYELVLPVVRAGQLKPEQMRGKNLLLVGDAKQNAVVRRLTAEGQVRPQPGLSVFQHEDWTQGGNYVVVAGSPPQREQARQQLVDWFWQWFDLGSWAPVERMAAELQRRLRAGGAALKRVGPCLVAEQGGRRDYYLWRTDQIHAKPVDWFALARLGRGEPSGKGRIEIVQTDFSRLRHYVNWRGTEPRYYLNGWRSRWQACYLRPDGKRQVLACPKDNDLILYHPAPYYGGVVDSGRRMIRGLPIGDYEIRTRVKPGTRPAGVVCGRLLVAVGGARLTVRRYDLNERGGIRFRPMVTSHRLGVDVDPDAWYRILARARKGRLSVKVWPDGRPEPDAWQVHAEGDTRDHLGLYTARGQGEALFATVDVSTRREWLMR